MLGIKKHVLDLVNSGMVSDDKSLEPNQNKTLKPKNPKNPKLRHFDPFWAYRVVFGIKKHILELALYKSIEPIKIKIKPN